MRLLIDKNDLRKLRGIIYTQQLLTEMGK